MADDEFVTAGSAAADHVAAHHPGARVLVLGGDGLTVPMTEAGMELVERPDGAADVVVVGAADSYTTAQLNAACLAVDAGAPLYVTVRTPWFHGGFGKSIAVSSAIAAAVSWVTGVEAQVTGKPSAALAERLLARFGATDRRTWWSSATTPPNWSSPAPWVRAACSCSAAPPRTTASLPCRPIPPPTSSSPTSAPLHDLVRPHLNDAVGARS